MQAVHGQEFESQGNIVYQERNECMLDWQHSVVRKTGLTMLFGISLQRRQCGVGPNMKLGAHCISCILIGTFLCPQHSQRIKTWKNGNALERSIESLHLKA